LQKKSELQHTLATIEATHRHRLNTTSDRHEIATAHGSNTARAWYR